jgi:capsular exopolysaccharide synthesis family protein
MGKIRMNSFEDNMNHKGNSAGDNRQFHPDPTRHPKDDFSESHDELQHTEIVRSRKPFSPNDSPLVPKQFMAAREASQALPSAANILEMMYRFKWTIIAVFILAAAPAVAAIWTQIVPKYRARAELRIRPIIPHLVFRTEDNGMIPLYDSFVNTQVSIMKSLEVLGHVLDQPEVQETEWYKNPKKSLKQQLLGHPTPTNIERLRRDLRVMPRRGTEIMDISFVHTNPEDAKLIVDEVLEQYIQYIGLKSDKEQDALYLKIQEQHRALEEDIKGREATIAELRENLGTASPQDLISMMRLRIEDTKSRISELTKNIEVLEWELAQKNAQDANNVSGEPSVLLAEKQRRYSEDPEWRSRDINVRTIEHQIATSLLQPKHPDRAKAEMDLKFAKELLRLREAQLDQQWADEQKNAEQESTAPVTPIIIATDGSGYQDGPRSLEHQLNRAKEELKQLQKDSKQQQADFAESFADAQMLENENNELQHKRDLFKAVQQRLDAKKMEKNVSGTIQVLTNAFAPSTPHNDRRIMLTGMALFLGLCMGGGAAFLKGTITQTIYSHKDMPYPMQVPFLGYIPACRSKKSPDKEFIPAMVESIRVVRTALLSRLNNQGHATVLVTSADASTGKSTFTMMLGKSLAQAGKKVLIIDADFRKITLTKRFNLPDKSGFLESLSSKSVNKRHIYPTETFGLSIMPAGKRSNNGAIFEETANGAFKACIGQLRKQYNVILLDSSPILPVADATILSSQVDGTIMVERELVSRRANVINALSRLGSAGGRLLGTVFVGSSDLESYGYDYKYSRTNGS